MGGFAAGCGSASQHAQATAAGFVRPHLESIFEDEHLLHTNPANAFEVMRRLGVDRMRVYIGWGYIAPDPKSRAQPASFNAADPAAYPAATMAIYDTIVREAARHGVGIDMTVGGPAPLWGAGSGAPAGTPPQYQAVWKPSAPEFGQFVRAIATRYDGRYTPPGATAPLPRVTFWSVWNEPNYGPDLAPQATDHSTVEVSPALYRGLLDAAWSALQATGHGHDTILIGETAPRGQTTGDQPGNFSGMVPLRFIRALYCVDDTFTPLHGADATARGCPPDTAGSQQFTTAHPALFAASGFADHPYPQGQIPPNVPTPQEPDFADLAALPNLEHTLDRARAAYGSHPTLPIYSTEFGFQTDPPEALSRAIDPLKAAYYMNWSEYISWRNPRLLSYDQYLLSDPPGANSLGGFATGLRFFNGTPKATYPAYILPLYLPVAQAKRGQALEAWGAVRPARYAQLATHAPQRAHLEFRASSAGAFQTVKTLTITDADGYFDTPVSFGQTGTLRLAWTYPHGPTIYSRSVTVTIN